MPQLIYTFLFYLAACIAVATTAIAITRSNPVHALIYLALSLIGVAVMLYTLGAAFVAALEVIVYAGAIVVLFVFVTMLLNLGAAAEQERKMQPGRGWIVPSIFGLLLLAEFLTLTIAARPHQMAYVVTPAQVGTRLMNGYAIGVELTSMMLLGAVIAAYHLGVTLAHPRDHAAGAGTEAEAGVVEVER